MVPWKSETTCANSSYSPWDAARAHSPCLAWQSVIYNSALLRRGPGVRWTAEHLPCPRPCPLHMNLPAPHRCLCPPSPMPTQMFGWLVGDSADLSSFEPLVLLLLLLLLLLCCSCCCCCCCAAAAAACSSQPAHSTSPFIATTNAQAVLQAAAAREECMHVTQPGRSAGTSCIGCWQATSW